MKKENIIKIIKYLFLIYCIGLIFILFFNGSRRGNQFNLKVFSKEHFEMTNIIPFRTITSYLKVMKKININIVVTNLLGNLLMFTPMGMALPVLFDKKFNKLWKVVAFVIVLVLIIEIIQFITFAGSADIDDLILNTIGAIIGYGIIKNQMIRKLLKIDE
jgi:glycopeptide antibiotics resistance protein